MKDMTVSHYSFSRISMIMIAINTAIGSYSYFAIAPKLQPLFIFVLQLLLFHDKITLVLLNIII